MELTWNDEVVLISAKYTEDELGQPVATETKLTVCCCRQPTPRQEVYFARQSGIEVNETLIIHPYEYSGENVVDFNGKRLHVIKVYQKGIEELELTCAEKTGDKNG